MSSITPTEFETEFNQLLKKLEQLTKQSGYYYYYPVYRKMVKIQEQMKKEEVIRRTNHN